MEREPSYFFNFEKLAYIRNPDKDLSCILCGVRDRDPNIENLTIEEGTQHIVTLNLYPFNPGHLLIFPRRHLLDLAEYTQEEVLELHALTVRWCQALRETHHAQGFNLGWNMGHCAGASIAHLHQHIIPRYPREIGMAELIGGNRVLVESPRDTAMRLSVWAQEHPR